MAVVKISVSDVDLGEDTYKVEFSASGAELENGHATAAYFVGYFLHEKLDEPDFIQGVAEYGKMLIDSMTDAGHDKMPMKNAKVVLTIEDEDLTTGRYKATIQMLDGDSSGTHLPTVAQILGTYMRTLISSTEFQLACWQFADDFVKEQDGRSIANPEQSPIESPAQAA